MKEGGGGRRGGEGGEGEGEGKEEKNITVSQGKLR